MKDHKKSLELFQKFLNETPKEKLDAMIDEIDAMKIEGPTVPEYFASIGIDVKDLEKEE